jgi:hypothetical protein
MRRLKRLLLVLYLPGNCSMRRLRRLLLVRYLLHGPSLSTASRPHLLPAVVRWWESGPSPLAALSPDFSLRRMTMRLEIVKICSRAHTMLATIT